MDSLCAYGNALAKIEAHLTWFSTGEVSRVSGVSKSRLNHWDRTDIVWPSISRPSKDGRGFRVDNARGVRAWSLMDIMAVKLVGTLRDKYGFSLQRIRKALRYLESKGINKAFHQALDPITPVVLSISGADLELHDGESAWSLINKPGQGILILNREIANPVSQEVIELYSETVEPVTIIKEPSAEERQQGRPITEEIVGIRRYSAV